MTMKYIILVPDGNGIRNFLCTRFLDYLLETGDVCVWHGLPQGSLVPYITRYGSRVQWVPLPPTGDGQVERLLRKSKSYAQLYWHRRKRNDHQLQRLRRPGAWKARLVDNVSRAFGRLLSTPRSIFVLHRLHEFAAVRAPHIKAFEDFITEWKPSIVFCTHQRALEAVPALLAARKLGVPTASFIYSWDNLPKGRMPIEADHYLVWSEFMKGELQTYYPDVKPHRIRVVGTPQFEDYFNKALILPREEFFATLKLDPARPVICFSGDDDLASPFDQMYLWDLATEMRKIPDARRPQILFRRSPVDRKPRYDETLRTYPEIAVSDPQWRSYDDENWTQIIPTQEDVALLTNVVYHSDMVVNVGSTMALDFATYDKPGVYLAYCPPGTEDRYSIDDFYALPHFRMVKELDPVYWARSAADLGDIVRRALSNPEEKKKERLAWLNRIVAQPMNEASRRFADTLRDLATRPR
jgi:hypothetical protein